MISDCLLPPGLGADTFDIQTRRGVSFASAQWTPGVIAKVMSHLAVRGPAALDRLDISRRLDAWERTIEAFLEPRGQIRCHLDPALRRLSGLSSEGLGAALDNLLRGAIGPAARRMAVQARPCSDRRPVAIFLAGNIPGLALQALLPPLLVGRPVLLKTPSAEPLFTPCLAAELVAREPALADALAVLTWPGGHHELERPVIELAGKVVAYGDQNTLDDLESRVGDRFVGLGPGVSLAAVSSEVEPSEVADGLARDIALFDQQGCLSIHAIYTDGDAEQLADALANALEGLAATLPPGPLDPLLATSVQQFRMQADLRALHRPELGLASGTVIVEPLPELQASPGLRSVRIHPVRNLGCIPEILAPWRGRLQGMALAGAGAWKLQPAMSSLGCCRFSAPGDLQKTDFDWLNGGRSPLETFGAATNLLESPLPVPGSV